MVADYEHETTMILALLGIEGTISSQKIGLKKQNSRPLREIIENYDDLVQVLSGTQYERWLCD